MIYLIRHMQSMANVKHIAGGNYPLTDEGIKEAKRLKVRIEIKPDVIVVSPLIRALQTAQILFPEKEFIIDNDFREIHFGDYENTIMEDNEFLRIYNTCPSRIHEITHGDVIKERADKAIIKILNYFPKGEIAIASHDTLMRAIICRLKGECLDEMPKYKRLLPNGSILKLDLSAKMEIINDRDKVVL